MLSLPVQVGSITNGPSMTRPRHAFSRASRCSLTAPYITRSVSRDSKLRWQTVCNAQQTNGSTPESSDPASSKQESQRVPSSPAVSPLLESITSAITASSSAKEQPTVSISAEPVTEPDPALLAIRSIMEEMKEGKITMDEAVKRLEPYRDRPEVAEAFEAAMIQVLNSDLKEMIKNVVGFDQKEMEALGKLDFEEFLVNDKLDFDAFMEKVLGPVLEAGEFAEGLRAIGVEEKPYSFLLGVLQYVSIIHLITATLLFYGTELGLQYDGGEAFRVVSGFGLGLVTRPFVRSEIVVWPVLGGLASLLPGEDGEAMASVMGSGTESAAEVPGAINGMVGVLAAALLLPQLLLGWHQEQCLQLVLPLLSGWVMFDLSATVALLIRLNQRE
jgi:hypothetical protein